MAQMNKPPPGYHCRRRLQLKLAMYRNWLQGGVVEIIQPGLAYVNVLRPDQGVRPTSVGTASTLASEWRSIMLFSSMTMTSLQISPGMTPNLTSVRSTVQCSEEVDQLKACGVELPDCPLQMLPGGYYD